MQRQCPECGNETDQLTCPDDGEMTLVVKEAKRSDSLVGQVIGGRYRVDKIIGQGGFGAVYRAIHTATGDTLAIKVLRTDVVGSSDVVARFRQEAKTTSKLKHPNTVRVFDFGQMDDGNLFLAMEFLDGRTMTDVMRDEGPLAPERLVKMGLQVLKSLSEAHSKGLIHRDLKPDNIFIQKVHGEPDFVRVLDFGIAKSLAAGAEDLTSTGAVIGTPKYMSPEQARGQKIDARTDIYSLAVILFEGLSGTPPFMAETPLAMILRRVTEEPPRVHDSIVRPTPIGLCDVVLKALSRRADDRFATADLFADALTASLLTPVQFPGGQVQAAALQPSQTAAYAAGQIAVTDETVDVSSDQIIAYVGGSTSSQQVVIHAGADEDATFEASPEQLLAITGGDVTFRVAASEGASTTVTPVVSVPDAPGGPPPSFKPSSAPSQRSGASAAAASTVASSPVRSEQGAQSATQSATQSGAESAAAKRDHSAVASRPQSDGGLGNKMPVIAGALIALGALITVVLLSGRTQHVVVTHQPAEGGPVAAAPVAAPVAALVAAPVVAEPAPVAAPVAVPVAVPVAAPVAPKQATLEIERSPSDAAVQIDGTSVIGTRTVLPAGKYVVKASARHYEDHEETIEVAAGETRKIAIDLVRSKSRPSSKPTAPTAPTPPTRPVVTAQPAPLDKPTKPDKPKRPPPPPGGLLID